MARDPVPWVMPHNEAFAAAAGRRMLPRAAIVPRFTEDGIHDAIFDDGSADRRYRLWRGWRTGDLVGTRPER
jgi:hypothetical protein